MLAAVLWGSLIAIAFSIFSYALTAPNLVLTSWPPYWGFQTWMWDHFFNDRQLLAQSFLVIMSLFWAWYFAMGFLFSGVQKQLGSKFLWLVPVIVALPLILSSVALSYDIFNYLFNAKMVVIYQTNPHQAVAASFEADPWLRFMHNVHTPAPYGYGWTALTVLPFLVTQSSFTVSLAAFKVLAALSYLGLLGFYWWYLQQSPESKKTSPWAWWAAMSVLTNPLVMVEVLSSGHNDLWMMVSALFSLTMVSFSRTQYKSSKTHLSFSFLSLLLLLFSIQIKLATLVLVPVWLLLVFQSEWPTILSRVPGFEQRRLTLLSALTNHWPLLSSLMLFIPLLTERSKWYLPWYLLWSLVWIPLIKIQSTFNKLWVAWLYSASIAVSFRYVPFLLAGNYEQTVISQQLGITWGVSALLVPVLYWYLQKTIWRYQKQL